MGNNFLPKLFCGYIRQDLINTQYFLNPCNYHVFIGDKNSHQYSVVFCVFCCCFFTEDGVPRTSRSMSLTVGKVFFQASKEIKIFNEDSATSGTKIFH